MPQDNVKNTRAISGDLTVWYGTKRGTAAKNLTDQRNLLKRQLSNVLEDCADAQGCTFGGAKGKGTSEPLVLAEDRTNS